MPTENKPSTTCLDCNRCETEFIRLLLIAAALLSQHGGGSRCAPNSQRSPQHRLLPTTTPVPFKPTRVAKVAGRAFARRHPQEPGRIYRCVRTQWEDDALRIFPANHGQRPENPWGYGDDILIVRDEGVRLGLIRKAGCPAGGCIERPTPNSSDVLCKSSQTHKKNFSE